MGRKIYSPTFSMASFYLTVVIAFCHFFPQNEDHSRQIYEVFFIEFEKSSSTFSCLRLIVCLLIYNAIFVLRSSISPVYYH